MLSNLADIRYVGFSVDGPRSLCPDDESNFTGLKGHNCMRKSSGKPILNQLIFVNRKKKNEKKLNTKKGRIDCF